MKCEDTTQTQSSLIFSGLANLLLCSAKEYSLLLWLNKMGRSTMCTELSIWTQEMRNSEVGIIWIDGRVHPRRHYLRYVLCGKPKYDHETNIFATNGEKRT